MNGVYLIVRFTDRRKTIRKKLPNLALALLSIKMLNAYDLVAVREIKIEII